MSLYRLAASVLALLFFSSPLIAEDGSTYTVTSPDGRNHATLILAEGRPLWRVDHGATPVILPSPLGFRLRSGEDLTRGFTLAGVTRDSVDTSWRTVWGERDSIRDHHRALRVELAQENTGWTMVLHLRAYDDGVALRYELPDGNPLDHVEIMDEATGFTLAGDHSAWWIPAYTWNRYEYLYQQSAVSALDTVHTPLTLETREGLVLAIHEAALTDYASMTLARRDSLTLEADLVPWSDGVRVRRDLPMASPWRTVQIGERPGDLVESTLILNCNEPNLIEDTSWIEPGKYVGIWWGMHLGLHTWGSGEKHGATTERTKRYIDFAAEHGFDGVLVEGWNLGWDGDWVANASFDFTTPYPDFDLEGLADYARNRGVRLIGHHETAGGILNYERQMDEAFALYERLGVRAAKTGYVHHGQSLARRDPATGDTLGMEWHHGQWMVNHYRKVVEAAARHHIMLDVHEPIKATGIRRTWPNMMTREGARGQEYNAWGPEGGNPPEHTTILPYTRLLGGPFDFTPGIVDLTLDGDGRPDNRVNTSLAKQLALYVILFSPLQMAADLPENYEGHPAMPFIEAVPAEWGETLALNGRIGDYITLARKDRHSGQWYLGSITDEHPRSFRIPLDFLEEGLTYRAVLYLDEQTSHWRENPEALAIRERTYVRGDVLDLRLAPGGGAAVRLVPQR